MTETLIDKLMSTDEGMREFQQERAILETTELICKLMEEKRIRRSELAGRLGKTKGYITQLLDGRTNMTLRTISDVLWALEGSMHISAGPLSANSEERFDDVSNPCAHTVGDDELHQFWPADFLVRSFDRRIGKWAAFESDWKDLGASPAVTFLGREIDDSLEHQHGHVRPDLKLTA